MSLRLPELVPQVELLANDAIQQAQEAAKRLPQAERALSKASHMDHESLLAKIRKAGERWPGAIPTEEPLDSIIPAPNLPQPLTILAADGSQVYPDRHGAALYFLINIGSIRIFIGSGEPPQTSSTPRIFYERADLYSDDGGLISNTVVNGMRDGAEMGELACLAAASKGEPTLALLDNGLLLWLALQARETTSKQIDKILQQYLGHLNTIRSTGAAIAGYVDRPRNANLLALLHLAGLPEDEINESTLRLNPYQALTDRALYSRILPPGHRSARLTNASPVNRRDFASAGHEVQFFYLNPGEDFGVARIEVPVWITERPDLMSIVHAGILEQCRTTGGFPYVLVRAHELAVVTHPERQALDQILSQELLRRGLSPRISQKSRTKRWTGHRRLHRV